MKRISKLIYASIVVVLCAFSLLPVQAAETESEVGVDYTINCSVDGVALTGVEVSLYRVADLTSMQPAQFTLTEDFSSYPVDLENNTQEEWNAVCTTLNGYINADALPPMLTAATDETGSLSFMDLERGLYLVQFEAHEQDGKRYTGSPLLVCLPGWGVNSNDWIYSVTSFGKFTVEDVPVDETTSRSVVKIWSDKGYESKRPKEIVVRLYQDKKLLDTVTLNDANQWSYKWTDLPVGYTYDVVEQPVSGYKVSIEKDGNAFKVTNTFIKPDVPTEKPTKHGGSSRRSSGGKLPQTGQMWWPVGALTLCGLVFMVLGVRMRKVRRHG